LDHGRQALDLRVVELLAPDRLAPGQPALVERLLDQLPRVPQVFDQLVREVAEPVLQAELIDQRAALIAH
jgi:hypothetical protein